MPSSSDSQSPVEVLVDEFLARCKRGEKPTIKEYWAQHPELPAGRGESFPGSELKRSGTGASSKAVAPSASTSPPVPPPRG